MHVQSDVLLLADVFNNFPNTYLEICRLDPVHFISAPGLTLPGVLKRTKVKLDLSTDIDMLSEVSEVEYVMVFIDIPKLLTNTWKIMIQNKESS